MAQEHFSKRPVASQAAVEEAVPLGYDNVLFPCLVLVSGCAFSLLIFAGEIMGRFLKKKEIAHGTRMAWLEHFLRSPISKWGHYPTH